MTLMQLKYISMVAKCGSFSKAAQNLYVSQPGISKMVYALEEELGVQLFDRLPKGITLTRPGEVLLKHARSLLLEAENARLAVKSQREPSGKLRIGAFSSLCTAFLPDLLRQYHQLYPKVDLVVRSGGIEALRDMLGSGRLDFAWVIADWKERSPWRAFCGMSHPIWAVAAPGRYGPGKILPASGLEDVTFLLTEPGCPYRRQFELFCSKNGIVPHVLMEADSILRLANCDPKSVNYFASQLPLLDGPEWDMDKQYKVASNVKPYQAADHIGKVLGDTAFVLPYSQELEEQYLAGNLLADLALKDSRPFRKELERIIAEVF